MAIIDCIEVDLEKRDSGSSTIEKDDENQKIKFCLSEIGSGESKVHLETSFQEIQNERLRLIGMVEKIDDFMEKQGIPTE